MSLKIDTNKAVNRIDEFLKQIDKLLDQSYAEGEDEYYRMSTKIDNFAETAFSDGEKKKKKLHPGVAVARMNPSEAQKQEEYEENLKRKKRHLEAWKEQIQLEESVETDDGNQDNYEGLRDEISKVQQELPLYASDLELSINELECSHYLASVMISGRVIDYTLDQVKSSQRLGGPEEVIKHLEEEGIIDSPESKITASIKSYRNIHTHEIGKTPDSSEALIILAGCVKLLNNICEADKAKEYDLA